MQPGPDPLTSPMSSGGNAPYRCPVRCLGSSAGFTKVIPQGPMPCTCTTVSSFVTK